MTLSLASHFLLVTTPTSQNSIIYSKALIFICCKGAVIYWCFFSHNVIKLMGFHTHLLAEIFVQ